ncbi:helix-turn-helix transcriptional regulator [Streptomyces sp. TRM66268-LWL]|uniref:Helix-turn-helix transcriptional regulator n=1 Tax=Streptomyces polyasparticus TaxID=2767826 RepID=A0ABR7SGJ3_9ACTN|nr:helix-turn-helix transcriptional regulator [Streptomyces polyasparticus]MBC9714089.1 helix-turn-helix transcriptional regulator [Streptomyces polyasparticus]
MSWTSAAIRDASRAGDYGRVVHLARRGAGLSQKELGDACGVSQSAVSRLEQRGANGVYDTKTLARAAAHLQLPPHLVGLADHAAALAANADTDGSVERRNFLGGAVAVAAAPAVAAFKAATTEPAAADGGPAATLRVVTGGYRRLDGTTPARQLVKPVLEHLELTQSLAKGVQDHAQRNRLAAVGSEVASLAGWLSWDMGDYGSARTWYGAAVKSARRSGQPLLAAYQLGSLAQFEAHAGNAQQGLSLAQSARKALGDRPPVIADAWLASVEALCHAAAGDAEASDDSLKTAIRFADRVTNDSTPWPWVFTFNESKVAATRVACGARLGRSDWISSAQDSATAVLSSGHEKQRALLILDVASGHLASGRIDGAFALATGALEIGLRFRSGRIVERARALRRSYATPRSLPRVVREFDDRLYEVFL